MFKFLEKPLVPIGVGPVYFQQRRKFICPGSEYFINRKQIWFFLFDMYNLKWLMITIYTCNICAVCLLSLTNKELATALKKLIEQIIKR